MDTSASIISEAIGQFYHAPSWCLLVAVSIVLGYMLKSIPNFPNRLIPMACSITGAILLPLLADPKALSPGQRHPNLVFALMGLVIAMTGWACHIIILKRLEKKFGLFPTPDEHPEKAETK